VVEFFEECNYGTFMGQFLPGTYSEDSFDVIEFPENTARSLRIPPGYEVTLFDSCCLTTRSVPSLTVKGDQACLEGTPLNADTSSMRICGPATASEFCQLPVSSVNCQ